MHKWCKRDHNLYSPVQSSTAAHTEDKTLLDLLFCFNKTQKQKQKNCHDTFSAFSITVYHNIPWHNQIFLVIAVDNFTAKGRHPNYSQSVTFNIALLHSLFVNSWRWISKQASFITKKALKHLMVMMSIGDSGWKVVRKGNQTKY